MNTALAIDDCYSMYLVLPSPGIYIKGRLEPSIAPSQGPYQQYVVADKSTEGSVRTAFPITSDDIELIESTVYNRSGEVVVPAHTRHLLSNGPTVPVIAIFMVRELVNEFLQRNQAWNDDRTSHEYEIVRKYLKPEVLAQMDAMAESNDPDYLQCVDLIEDILTLMRSLRQEIQEFIGDEEWTVHFSKPGGTRDVMLIKSIDYRVLDWMERMESGEWKR